MNRVQEWANALTQLSPTLCYLYYVTVSQGAVSIPCWVLIISVWVHLPFSFYYHVQCAMRNDDCDFDPVRCWARRLDSTFIHLSAVCVSFGTSHGSLYYAGRTACETTTPVGLFCCSFPGVCTAFNLCAAALHWGKDVNVRRVEPPSCLLRAFACPDITQSAKYAHCDSALHRAASVAL